MKDKLATRLRQTPFCAVLMVGALLCACAAPGQVTSSLPGSGLQNYPPVIEDTPQLSVEGADVVHLHTSLGVDLALLLRQTLRLTVPVHSFETPIFA